ncbi:MAG TPA: C45 family peptidase [Acidimicrobiia bacterium]
MRGRTIRTLALAGDPHAMGRAHGLAHALEIREYAADRVARSADGTDWDRDRILELADACLPAHRLFSPSLYAEMEAMAEAAGLSVGEAMIVGGYTDFIDVVRAHAAGGRVEDTCTAVIVPDHRTSHGGFLAQTWDMHASATDHIVMLDVRPDDGPRALVFSTVGCLGQIGMNDRGIAVGINNLTAADGRVGVTWPFVVRAVLAQSTFDDALSCIVDAPVSGGHSFLLLSADGRGAVTEAMPTSRHVTELAAEPLFHTNHCLAPATVAVEGPRPAELVRSSVDRLRDAADLLLAGEIDSDRLMALTRDESSICRHPEPPFDYESCGAAIMRPATGDFWACWGVPSENDYEHFGLEMVESG